MMKIDEKKLVIHFKNFISNSKYGSMADIMADSLQMVLDITKKDNKDKDEDEIASLPVSLCKNCISMTKTIDGKCGKCGGSKSEQASKTIIDFVKATYSSSEGVSGLYLKDRKAMLYFDSDRAKKIVGIKDYLSCYLSNNLRVFTPAKISFGDRDVEIELIAEGVSFVVRRVRTIPPSMSYFPLLDEKDETG